MSNNTTPENFTPVYIPAEKQYRRAKARGLLVRMLATGAGMSAVFWCQRFLGEWEGSVLYFIWITFLLVSVPALLWRYLRHEVKNFGVYIQSNGAHFRYRFVSSHFIEFDARQPLSVERDAKQWLLKESKPTAHSLRLPIAAFPNLANDLQSYAVPGSVLFLRE